MDIYAWIGEDEFPAPNGPQRIGLKQAVVPAGTIPLAAMDFDEHKLRRAELVAQLQAQANRYGRVIRLARFTYVEDVIAIVPERRN